MKETRAISEMLFCSCLEFRKTDRAQKLGDFVLYTTAKQNRLDNPRFCSPLFSCLQTAVAVPGEEVPRPTRGGPLTC
jgi:hypothetical protein